MRQRKLRFVAKARARKTVIYYHEWSGRNADAGRITGNQAGVLTKIRHVWCGADSGLLYGAPVSYNAGKSGTSRAHNPAKAVFDSRSRYHIAESRACWQRTGDLVR